MPLVRRRPLAGMATLGVVALIAGCGGGGSSDTLSADEFRSQADAICADYNTQAAALTDPSSPSEYLASLKEIVPLQSAQVDKLAALKPPSELSADFAAAIALLKKQQAALASATTRIEGGEDPTAVISDLGAEAGTLGDQADAKAKALGLTVCGTNGDGTTDTTSTTGTAPVDTAPATDGTTSVPADTTGTAASGTGDTAGYVADVQEAATALQSFGTLLQGASGVADLKAKVPEAERALDEFDAAIAKLAGYTLAIEKLDQQRAGLARTGPKVSDVLRRFLAAASTGDLTAVQKLVPEVTAAIGEFQAAATG